MTAFRRQVLRHRAWFVGLLALTLLLKMVVPSGFMLGTAGGSVAIELCSGYGPETVSMHGPADHRDHKDGPGKTEMPCAFAGLSAPSLAAAGAVPLAAAVVSIVATGPRGIVDTTMPEGPAHLRPPLRGPPAQR